MQLQTEIIEKIRVIGDNLDINQYPRVYNGGFVRPIDPPVPLTQGQEVNYVQSSRRSTTGSRQRPQRRQRQTSRSGTPSRRTPIIDARLRIRYEEQLGAVQEAYPGAINWCQDNGMWLLTESSLFDGLGQKATFLTNIPYISNVPKLGPRSWGFWTTPVFCDWIGPRHTNMPDGSICAFEPQDRSWRTTLPLVKLLDLYSVWAARHLHLKLFGRWPGYQSVPYVFERCTEIKDTEFCGCSLRNRRYIDCCKQSDIQAAKVENPVEYLRKVGRLNSRVCPTEIVNLVRFRNNVPPVSRFFTS